MVAWLNDEWLPSVVGAAAAESLKAVPAMPVDGASDFAAAVDGTEADRDGTDGKLTFNVLPVGGGLPVYKGKVCTIKAAVWEPSTTVGDFVVTGGIEGEHFTYADGVLTFIKPKDEGSFTVSMSPSLGADESTSDRIVVAADAAVELSGVRIETVGVAAPPIEVSGYNVTLSLTGANAVWNTSSSPGIRKSGSTGKLVIKGMGSLFVQGGGDSAAIGGARNENAGNIRIEGGSVHAVAEVGAAAIGGGSGGGSFGLEVAGGFVEAEGGVGIGSANSTYAQVSITGGTVRAESIGVSENYTPDSYSSYVSISGGSVEADLVSPAPTHDGKTLAHVAYAVRADHDPKKILTRDDLLDGKSVPAYYNLTGAVPDGKGNVHLWLDKSGGLTASVPVGGGDASFELAPGVGTVLAPGSHLTAGASDATSGLIDAALKSIPGFSDAELESAEELDLSPVSTVAPPVVDEVAYPLGTVFSMNGKDYLVIDVAEGSFRYAGLPAKGGGVFSGSVYERAETEHHGVTETWGIEGVTTKRSEPSVIVSANGAHYREAYTILVTLPDGSPEVRSFLYAADGTPAGYYVVRDSSGAAVFNKDMDPNSVKGSGVLQPSGQLALGGKNYLFYALFSGDVSLAGGGDPRGSTLAILTNTRLAGSSPEGPFLAGSSHFTGEAFEAATSVECEAVRALDGVVELSAKTLYKDLSSMSPFAVVVAVEDAFQVPVMKVDPWPVEGSGGKPLASTGDPTAAGAAALAALALVAAASLALTRRKGRA